MTLEKKTLILGLMVLLASMFLLINVTYHVKQYIGFFRDASLRVRPKGPHWRKNKIYTIRSKFMIGVHQHLVQSSHYDSMMFLGMTALKFE